MTTASARPHANICIKWWPYYYLTHSSHTHTHARARTHTFNGPFSRTTGSNVKPIWLLLKQETVSGSGISWAMCKSASRSRQITMPVPHHSFFTGRMPFLPPNQQRQSTEGKSDLTTFIGYQWLTSFQKDNHANISSLNFYGPDAIPDADQQHQSTGVLNLNINRTYL